MHLGLHKPLLLATALVFLCLSLPPSASAIDPGRVQGTLQVNGQATSHALQETHTLPAPAGPDAAAWAKPEAAKLQASLKLLLRVVVRSNRAVAIFTNKKWQTFIRTGGEWKIDN